MDQITITVPARSEYVPILRTVVAGVAARLELPYDGVDDLRLATDEAAAHLLSLDERATTILVRMRSGNGAVEVVSTIDARPEPWPPADADQTLAWQVISGLTDEASFGLEEGNAAIRFLRRTT